MQWSDSVQKEKFNQYVSHTRKIIAESHFKKYKLSFYQKRRYDKLIQKTISRKQIKFIVDGMSIIKKNALKIIEEKRQKEQKLINRKERNNFMRG